MTDFYDGGPVFPQERMLPCGSHEDCEGISLRDYFAAKAMTALVPLNHSELEEFVMEPPEGVAGYTVNLMASIAYEIADAMLRARKA